MGGVKVHKGCLYVHHSDSTRRRYSLATVRASLKSSGTQSLGYGTALGVTGVSTFDIDAGHLYGAKFNGTTAMSCAATGHVHRRARHDTSGVRSRCRRRRRHPRAQQHLHLLDAVDARGCGNIYVVRRGYTRSQEFTDARYRCFQSVAMTQKLMSMNGVTYSRSTVLRLESGQGACLQNLLRVARALGVLDPRTKALDPYTTDAGRLRADEELPMRVRARGAGR